jgi:predicted amidohydrolase
MPLGEAITRSTLYPARAMGLEGRIGTLSPGAQADIALFRTLKQPTQFEDIHGDRCVSGLLLQPAATVRAGRLVFRADSGT